MQGQHWERQWMGCILFIPRCCKTFPSIYHCTSVKCSFTFARWTAWGSPPSKVSATLPNGRSAPSSTMPPPLNKPRNGSISSGPHPTTTSSHFATALTESEWLRGHAVMLNNQQEKFHHEQEAEWQLQGDDECCGSWPSLCYSVSCMFPELYLTWPIVIYSFTVGWL